MRSQWFFLGVLSACGGSATSEAPVDETAPTPIAGKVCHSNADCEGEEAPHTFYCAGDTPCDLAAGGTCTEKPLDCGGMIFPDDKVCKCDGGASPNACYAALGGQDVDPNLDPFSDPACQPSDE